MSYYRPVVRLAFVGWGSVARATVELLHQRRERLPFSPAVAGIFTRKLGCRWEPGRAFLPEEVLETLPPVRRIQGGGASFVQRVRADVVVELTPLNVADRGEPAAEHIRRALTSGKHVVTANKGPIAFHFAELRELARRHRRMLRFESTVADGLPIFNLVRHSLPATRIRRIRGVLNSTVNFILHRMAQGVPEMNAVAEARAAGIAEADIELDLEGWDAAIKCMVLAAALKQRLPLEAVVRESFRQRVQEILSQAQRNGGRPQQVVTLSLDEPEQAHASVRIQATPPDDPLHMLCSADLGVVLETDTMGTLMLVEKNPGLQQTAFGVVADLIEIYRHGIAPSRDPTLFDMEMENANL